ncbi:MAG: DUF819 family protein [Saprospiraceae bacterium]|nr:DUF819 family protein [Saprospiraceae bacterium]
MIFLVYTLFAIFFVFFPLLLRRLSIWLNLSHILSDLVICFGVGILLGNTQQFWMPYPVIQESVFSVVEICSALPVLIAIPLLLMTSDIRASFSYAPKLFLSFFLCVASVFFSVFIVINVFSGIENINKAIGCLVGVNVGGTPNMMAIGYAVDIPRELFLILNATDVLCSGLYFLFLLSVAKTVFGFFLPPFSAVQMEHAKNITKLPDETNFKLNSLTLGELLPLVKASFWAFIAIGISSAIALLIPDKEGNLNEMVLMVLLTTTSIAFSFNSKIQTLKGVYEYAQYLLLIFALAVGFMANFSKLANEGGSYLIFNAVFVIGLILIHLILSIVFRIDRDTFIITSTACVFGPPFIGQVCDVIKNKKLVAPGMALGILGLVTGTYLGIIVSSLIV